MQMSKLFTNKLSRRNFIGTGAATAGGFILGQNVIAKPGYCGKRKGPKSKVRIYVEGDMRIIESNGVPNHPTGQFPNPADPYAIGNQVFRFSVPIAPERSRSGPQPIDFWRFGVAINGVTFDPAGPNLLPGWQFEVLSFSAAKHLGIDHNNAHVQPYDRPGAVSESKGQYHYHGFPIGLYMALFRQAMEQRTKKSMFLLGYSADGFPIYAPSAPLDPNELTSQEMTMRSSYRLKRGLRRDEDPGGPLGEYDGTFVEDYEYVAGLGDLDECNGREGVTPEYPDGTYYYVVTREFPFVPRKFMGTPVDEAFNHPVAPGEEQTPQALAEYPH
jgi:hypothetical protein